MDLPESLPPLPRAYLPEPAPLPPGSLMPMGRNELFVGRESQLHELAEALQVQRTAVIGQVASVTGLGGIGKTQLAAEFVHRYGQFFTGGVFWLGFSDPASVPTEIALCGGPEHLNLWSIEEEPDIDTQIATIRRIFTGPEPRLLVFDNCEDEKLLAEWRPKTGGSRVLVTSRHSTFSAYLGVRTLPLDVLQRAESLALLRALDHGQPFEAADAETLDAICAELGDLPLALHLAGSFLACYRHTITPVTYLAQLRSRALLEHPSLPRQSRRGARGAPAGPARFLRLGGRHPHQSDAPRTWIQGMERHATEAADMEPMAEMACDRGRGYGSQGLESVDRGRARCGARQGRFQSGDVQVVDPFASLVTRTRRRWIHVRGATRSCRDAWIHVQDRSRLPSRPLLPRHGRQS
jgi:NB-ARC domain